MIPPEHAVEVCGLIDKLRTEECSSITIHADNADFNGLANCLITCERLVDGEMHEARFRAGSVLDCLRLAVGWIA